VIGLIVLALFVLGAIFFSDVPSPTPLHSMRTWQEADAPIGYPLGGAGQEPDGRVPEFPGDFVLLDGPARFRLPAARRLDWPGSPESGTLTRIVQPFLAEDASHGGRHLGIDLAPLGADGSQTSGTVYAVGNGVVVFAGDRGEVLGRVVVLGHRLDDGHLVHSLYGRLETIEVAPGALVARGQKIGTARGGSQASPAGLHLEFYNGGLVDPGSGYAPAAMNRREPAETIAKHRPASADDLAPEPLAAYEGEEHVFRIGAGGLPVQIGE
jgi:murein DD-endopeptidase MepM/ murein hydrolase activator NlpD